MDSKLLGYAVKAKTWKSLLPLSLYHEMHDLLLFHKVANNNYFCCVYDHVMPCAKNTFETQGSRNAFRIPKLKKKQKNKNIFLYRVPFLVNKLSACFGFDQMAINY